MELKVSDDCIFFFQDGHLIIDNYVKHVQKAIKIKYAEIILSLGEWTNSDQLEKIIEGSNLKKEEYLSVIHQLLGYGILISNHSTTVKPLDCTFNEWSKSVNYFHFNNRVLKDEKFKNVLYEYNELKDSAVQMPDIYKTYDGHKNVKLPSPTTSYISQKNFQDVLFSRETIRSFDHETSISLKQFSNLLYLVFGSVSCSLDHGIGPAIFKTSPSGGGRSSIEAYPVVFNVDGLDNGVYHYSVKNHELELISQGDFREEMTNIAGDQVHVGWPAASVIYTSVLQRVAWKYKTSRGYKAIYMDVGHLSQTFYLVSNWMNLGAFFVGALRDEVVENFLGINPYQEIVIGASGIGPIKQNDIEKGRFVRDDVDYWEKRGEQTWRV